MSSREIVNNKLQSALDRLENAIKHKITKLESENTELRADIIKLRQELKFAHYKEESKSIVATHTPIPSAPQDLQADTNARLKSEIQMSLGQLKKMVV